MGESLLTVGKIVNTHGIKGELKIVCQTDFPEVRFAAGSKLLIQQSGQAAYIPVEVENARLHKSTYIVKFKEFDDINNAEIYKGWMIKVPKEQLVELPENEYYFHQIIGCQVVTEDNEELGTVHEILTPGANDVWVVSRPAGKPLLLPVIDDVVLDVDVRQKRIKVHLMEGLL